MAKVKMTAKKQDGQWIIVASNGDNPNAFTGLSWMTKSAAVKAVRDAYGKIWSPTNIPGGVEIETDE